MKKLLKVCYFLIWCFCTVTVLSSFKVEKVKSDTTETVKKAAVYLVQNFFKLKPSGNKNYITSNESTF